MCVVFFMSLNHNQMAYAAIVSTLIFGSIFVGFSGVFQTSESVGGFEPAAEEEIVRVWVVVAPRGDLIAGMVINVRRHVGPQGSGEAVEGHSL